MAVTDCSDETAHQTRFQWGGSRAPMAILVVVWVVFVIAVYCPDLGRGFVKDDFTWIRTAQNAIADPSALILQREIGFYRPVVTLTFVSDFVWSGWDARGYGWTNLVLYVLCAGAVVGLGQSLGLTRRAAALSAFLWAVNPHGINMALLWLSGRTALLLTLFSVLAGIAFVRRWYWIAAVSIALALLAKEEATALPVILLAWATLQSTDRRLPRAAIAATCLPLLAYLWLRSLTPALTPVSAPAFYQFTTDPWLLLRNVGEYLNRSTAIAGFAVAIGAVVYGALPLLDEKDRYVVGAMGLWWLGMFAVTMWLPVRSSLYAVCPSVGSAIIGAVIIDRLRLRATSGRFAVEPVLAALLLASISIYQARDDRSVEAARISARTIREIGSDLATLPQTGVVVLHDDPEAASFREAFGDLTSEALRITFNRQWDAWIESPPWSGASTRSGAVIAEYWIEKGRITRERRRF